MSGLLQRLWIANLAIQVLLGVSTGLVKLTMLPFEWALFETAGFSLSLYLLFGAGQLVAALLLLSRSVRPGAGSVAALLYLGASLVLVVNGQLAFAAFSLLFPASALWAGFGHRRQAKVVVA